MVIMLAREDLFVFPHDLIMFVLLNFMGWVLHFSYSVYRIDRVVLMIVVIYWTVNNGGDAKCED